MPERKALTWRGTALNCVNYCAMILRCCVYINRMYKYLWLKFMFVMYTLYMTNIIYRVCKLKSKYHAGILSVGTKDVRLDLF